MTISSDNFVEIFPETQKNNFHIYSPSPFSSFCEKKFQNLKKFFFINVVSVCAFFGYRLTDQRISYRFHFQ